MNTSVCWIVIAVAIGCRGSASVTIVGDAVIAIAPPALDPYWLVVSIGRIRRGRRAAGGHGLFCFSGFGIVFVGDDDT